MNILGHLRAQFSAPLLALTDEAELPALLDMIRPAQNAQHGDYQANFAMPLKNKLEKPPREIAADIVSQVDLSDCCDPPEVAGPGFINLRLKNDWLAEQIQAAATDERLNIALTDSPKTVVIDYSSPNVAKPMHVGHIRSTVIGDAIARTLRFMGHKVITDNHLGDWGTQFGMIIYGYKHFRDDGAFERAPVAELARLYKLVNSIITYHASKTELPKLENALAAKTEEIGSKKAEPLPGDKKGDAKHAKAVKNLERQGNDLRQKIGDVSNRIAHVEASAETHQEALAHEGIGKAVLNETAKLHEGDPENVALWESFLPHCRDVIQTVYSRLNVSFDHELGESFYHDQLQGVVDKLEQAGLSKKSEGAVCVFLDQFDTPMIVQKQDGAFLYATTDLATIDYRIHEWSPDAILYVVDHRQSEHFDKLFEVAKRLGHSEVDLRHISFGTVMDEQGKPFKTKEGVAAGLEGLLNQAVAKALAIVVEASHGVENVEEIADAVGHGAIKYADLAHNRTSDYIFCYEKMLALRGNTGAYLQYAHARVFGILRKAEADIDALRSAPPNVVFDHPAERSLALSILRFGDAIDDMLVDYRPNILTNYLYDLAGAFATFFENCPVLKADTEELKNSRMLLCDLAGRTMKQGLCLLGIEAPERM